MSKASIEHFYQEVVKDQALQEQLRAATSRESMASLAVQLGQEKGYSFTIDEAQAIIGETANASQQQQLSDEQLETVAGGAPQANFTDSWGCA